MITYTTSGPISMEEHWLIFLPVMIAGQGPYSFLLDTGHVGFASVTPAVAQELGQDVERQGYQPATFTIGQFRFEHPIVVFWDHSGVTRNAGREFAGMIGNRLLKDCRIYIDYPTGIFTLERSHAVAEVIEGGRCGNKLIINVYNEYLTVPVWINGTGPYRFILDTGAHECFISDEVASDLCLRATESRTEHDAIGCELSLHRSAVSNFRVGHVVCTDFPVVIQDAMPLTEYAGVRIDGLLGYSFLCHHKIMIDLGRNVLQLD